MVVVVREVRAGVGRKAMVEVERQSGRLLSSNIAKMHSHRLCAAF